MDKSKLVALLKRAYTEGYESGYNAGHIDAGDKARPEAIDAWDDAYAESQIDEVLAEQSAEPDGMVTCPDCGKRVDGGKFFKPCGSKPPVG